jgi:hypothetical protein
MDFLLLFFLQARVTIIIRRRNLSTPKASIWRGGKKTQKIIKVAGKRKGEDRYIPNSSISSTGFSTMTVIFEGLKQGNYCMPRYKRGVLYKG